MGTCAQTVLLQGKVPGDCCGRLRGRLLLTSRSFRFFARLKALSCGLLKKFLAVPSFEKIFSATRLLVVTHAAQANNPTSHGALFYQYCNNPSPFLMLTLVLSTTLRQRFRPKYYTKPMFRLKASISKGLRLFQY